MQKKEFFLRLIKRKKRIGELGFFQRKKRGKGEGGKNMTVKSGWETNKLKY